GWLLYALKVWMSRSQFKLTSREETGPKEIVIFAVQVYLNEWFTWRRQYRIMLCDSRTSSCNIPAFILEYRQPR
ncbi:hypothetical protein LSAT2_004575, partial [Lamellibrachia satsuma]